MGLNPFEFRAGLKRTNESISKQMISLNPFEFRAGLKQIDMAGYIIIES